MPFPRSLDPDLKLPPGTFIPSAKHVSNGLVEVREAIFAPNNDLYVADRAADCVRIYEAHTGHFLRNLVSGSDQRRQADPFIAQSGRPLSFYWKRRDRFNSAT